MKKIISMGISAAVLAVSAIAASAAIVPDTTDEAVAGEEIVVTVTTTEAIQNAEFTVVTEGLELVEYEKVTTGDMSLFNPDNGVFAGASTEAWAADTVLLTITYTVTAEAGETVSVAIEGEEIEAGDAVSLEVKEAAGGDEPGTEDPGTEDPGTEDPGTEDPGTEDPGTEIPSTGIALAVVPAVLAGAAVVVAKKRK